MRQFVADPFLDPLLFFAAGPGTDQRKRDRFESLLLGQLHGIPDRCADRPLRRDPEEVKSGDVNDRLVAQPPCTGHDRLPGCQNSMLSEFPERLVAPALFDRTGDSLGQQQPPRNEVSIPGVDDAVDVLIEQVAVDDLQIHVGRMKAELVVVAREVLQFSILPRGLLYGKSRLEKHEKERPRDARLLSVGATSVIIRRRAAFNMEVFTMVQKTDYERYTDFISTASAQLRAPLLDSIAEPQEHWGIRRLTRTEFDARRIDTERDSPLRQRWDDRLENGFAREKTRIAEDIEDIFADLQTAVQDKQTGEQDAA